MCIPFPGTSGRETFPFTIVIYVYGSGYVEMKEARSTPQAFSAHSFYSSNGEFIIPTFRFHTGRSRTFKPLAIPTHLPLHALVVSPPHVDLLLSSHGV